MHDQRRHLPILLDPRSEPKDKKTDSWTAAELVLFDRAEERLSQLELDRARAFVLVGGSAHTRPTRSAKSTRELIHRFLGFPQIVAAGARLSHDRAVCTPQHATCSPVPPLARCLQLLKLLSHGSFRLKQGSGTALAFSRNDAQCGIVSSRQTFQGAASCQGCLDC